MAEGITIVTPEVNKEFITKAFSAPRTLAPDTLAKSGKKPVVEGFKGDKRVFQDATRTVEIHVIKNLPHADGLVVAWLPKEKLLIYADMFNFPPASAPVPDPQVIGTRIFYENIAAAEARSGEHPVDPHDESGSHGHGAGHQGLARHRELSALPGAVRAALNAAQ